MNITEIKGGVTAAKGFEAAAAAAAISVSRRGASASIPTDQEVRQFLDSELP